MLSLLLACQEPSVSTKAVDPPADVPSQPLTFLRDLGVRSVVVVEVDTLRRDRLSLYGSERDTLPRTAAWPHAASEDHFSATAWTTPSVAALLTATDSHENGIFTVNPDAPELVERPTVQVLLAENGVTAALFNGNIHFGDHELTLGWAEARNPATDPGSGLDIVNRALAWLDEQPAGTPTVLHLRPFDPHTPWAPMVEDRGVFVDESVFPFRYEGADEEAQLAAVADALRSDDAARVAALKENLALLYDEELLGLDRGIDALLAGLAARGRDQDTLVVLTGDHGETIFDHEDLYGHGSTLHDEVVHLPLVFFHPGLDGVEVGPCATQSWDLYPTLLDLLGLPAMPDVRGRSALDECRDETRSSLYRRAEVTTLSFLEVRRGDVVALASCGRGSRFGFDHGVDPHELDRLPPEDPRVAELLPALDDYLAEVKAARPEIDCPLE